MAGYPKIRTTGPPSALRRSKSPDLSSPDTKTPTTPHPESPQGQIPGKLHTSFLFPARTPNRTASASAHIGPTERSGLLDPSSSTSSSSHQPSYGSHQQPLRRHGSYQRAGSDRPGRMTLPCADDGSPNAVPPKERIWYDQFTSTDWLRDTIADAFRLRKLQSRRDLRGRVLASLDGAQGWILAGLVGVLIACSAYLVTISDRFLFDLRDGYCPHHIFRSRAKCGPEHWYRWADGLSSHRPKFLADSVIEFGVFTAGTVLFSVIACLITLQSRTVLPTAEAAPAIDEDLADSTVTRANESRSGRTYYSAAGSGVAEVKVVLSGFVLHGYLGLHTLVLKAVGLAFSVSAGLCLGKEGPFVHIAACIGNIACRLFDKYNLNDAKRREIMSASAAGGVAVAFGAPIGGVLFSLEEVSYYFPLKTLFRTFFACIVAALSLKFLNPYGTGQIVLFEVRYIDDWAIFEIGLFILLGVLGGTTGALLIKASRIWANSFRRLGPIRRGPLLEVIIVAVVTACFSFGNRYTRLPVAELLSNLARPCTAPAWAPDSGSAPNSHLCPSSAAEVPPILASLAYAFVAKSLLTIITFGIKVPAGIYVPSMVMGGLLGRIVGHFTQMVILANPTAPIFASCSAKGGPEGCVVPGVFALAAAGATMCGVTRLSITLAIILFELTGSLNHVLPFSIAILVSKWTADALEPSSIYDLLTDMNSYPFLDNKSRPVLTTDVADLVSPAAFQSQRIIDISSSSFVPAVELRAKLKYLHSYGELDGALPILRNGILSGIIPAYDLEYALDRVKTRVGSQNFGRVKCFLDLVDTPSGRFIDEDSFGDDFGRRPSDWNRSQLGRDLTKGWNTHYNSDHTHHHAGSSCLFPSSDGSYIVSDFTPYINPAPVIIDIRAPMDQAYEQFVKLGLRHICVLREGKFAGLVHKKAFVQHIKMYGKEMNRY